jgi:hypothetical protein
MKKRLKQHAVRHNNVDSLFVSINLHVRSEAVTVAFCTKMLHQEELVERFHFSLKTLIASAFFCVWKVKRGVSGWNVEGGVW